MTEAKPNATAPPPRISGQFCAVDLRLRPGRGQGRSRPWHRPCRHRSGDRTSSPIGASSLSSSHVRPRHPRSGLRLVAVEPGLDQAGKDEADHRRAGQRDARAFLHEIAGVVDQFVGAFRGEAVGRIVDRARGLAGIIAIFGAQPLIDPGGGVADQLRDIGERFGRALEALADEAAGLVGGLAGKLVAAVLTWSTTVSCADLVPAGRWVRSRSNSRRSLSVVTLARSVTDRVGAFGKLILVGHHSYSFYRVENPDSPRFVPATCRESCAPCRPNIGARRTVSTTFRTTRRNCRS